MKFFTEGFENLLSSFFFNSENLLSSIGQCTWLHLHFPFGKFHLDIHNKTADNNGTPLPHETDFDISKDRFCRTDIFIRWFEDYQLPYQFVTLPLKAEICSTMLVQLFVHALVGIHLRTFIVLHGYFSLSVRPVDQQQRQLAVSFYLRWCYVRSGVGVSARRIGSAMNRFYTKQTTRDISRDCLGIAVFIDRVTKHEVEGIATIWSSDNIRCHNKI